MIDKIINVIGYDTINPDVLVEIKSNMKSNILNTAVETVVEYE